jgi:hypothetical protein
MSAQFYAQKSDEDRLLLAVGDHQPITVTGLNVDGKIQAFSGKVLSLDNAGTPHPDYPLTVKIDEAAN